MELAGLLRDAWLYMTLPADLMDPYETSSGSHLFE
jgi:hypothetical protein